MAASGGVDSMVLLEILARVSAPFGHKISVCHFNHGLRGAASDRDEKFVQRAALRLGCPFLAARGDIPALAKVQGLSLEMAARQLRHQFFIRAALHFRTSHVALGHHADDQVELFFMRLFRGSGAEGLTGMRPVSPSPYNPDITLLRPFWKTWRLDIETFARSGKIEFREDASNRSLDIQRNYFRHKLIPSLVKQFPNLRESVWRSMEILAAESDFLQKSSAQWIGEGRRPSFANLPPALQRRIIRQELTRLKILPSWNLIEVLRLHEGKPVSVGPGEEILRNRDGVCRPRRSLHGKMSHLPAEIELPGKSGDIQFGGLQLEWKITPRRGGFRRSSAAEGVETFDAQKVGWPIRLRHWKPGDRFQPIGLGKATKLQDLFVNAHIAADERRKLVVAETSAGDIFWVEGLRIGEGYKLDKTTLQRLKWKWRRL